MNRLINASTGAQISAPSGFTHACATSPSVNCVAARRFITWPPPGGGGGGVGSERQTNRIVACCNSASAQACVSAGMIRGRAAEHVKPFFTSALMDSGPRRAGAHERPSDPLSSSAARNDPSSSRLRAPSLSPRHIKSAVTAAGGGGGGGRKVARFACAPIAVNRSPCAL